MVNATGWLDADQRAQIGQDTAPSRFHFRRVLNGDSFAARREQWRAAALGEGEVIADLDFSEIDRRKAKMDSRGHYSRLELLTSLVDHTPAAHMRERATAASVYGRTEW